MKFIFLFFSVVGNCIAHSVVKATNPVFTVSVSQILSLYYLCRWQLYMYFS